MRSHPSHEATEAVLYTPQLGIANPEDRPGDWVKLETVPGEAVSFALGGVRGDRKVPNVEVPWASGEAAWQCLWKQSGGNH